MKTVKICSNCKMQCKDLHHAFCSKCRWKYETYGDPNSEGTQGVSEPLTQKQVNLTIGHLLGDGCLKRRTDTANTHLAVNRSNKDTDYLRYSIDIFSNLFSKMTDPLKHNIEHEMVYFDTRKLKVFNDFYEKWYPRNENGERKKIVPRDLILNADIVAIWICDDGCVSYRSNDEKLDEGRKQYGMTIGFATNGFVKSDVEFLAKLLSDRYDAYFSVVKHTRKKKFNGELLDEERIEYYILAATHAAIKIIRDIESIFPVSMKRKMKWNEEILRHFETSSQVKSSAMSFKRKEHDLIGFLANSPEQFYVNDVAVKCNWFQKNGIPSRKNITDHLHRYMDLGYVIRGIKTVDTHKKGKGTIYTITPSGRLFFASELSKLQQRKPVDLFK